MKINTTINNEEIFLEGFDTFEKCIFTTLKKNCTILDIG
jgi:hypothetical protein